MAGLLSVMSSSAALSRREGGNRARDDIVSVHPNLTSMLAAQAPAV